MTSIWALAWYGALGALAPKLVLAQVEHSRTNRWPPENRRTALWAGVIDYAVEVLVAMATGAVAAVMVAKVGVVLTIDDVKVGGPNVAAAIVAGVAAPSVIKLIGSVGPKGTKSTLDEEGTGGGS